jgi:type II secretory pathway component PulC
MQLRFSQIHVTILNFVLIAALAIVSAICVRDIIARSVASDNDVPLSTSGGHRGITGLRTRAYYDTIVKRDIFNQTPQENAAPPPVVEADLNIKLIGTSLISRSKPYAIIEDPAGNESLYQVGEDIPDAGKLVSVETNRAIIDRGGHRVSIEIPTTDISTVPPSDLGGLPTGGPPNGIAAGRAFRGLPAALRRRLRGLRARAPTISGDDNDDSNDDDKSDDDKSDDDSSSNKVQLKKLGPGKFEVSRNEVQQTMENPAQFFSQMRAMPHFVNGKTDGFSISQVQPGSVFDQLGLQNGDLLTSIDGQPVTNPMQAMGLIQAVKTASAIDLVVNRGGAPTSVHLDLR